MTDQRHSGDEAKGRRSDRDSDAIARLMRLAGPRAEVPPDVHERVRTAVTGEWRSAVRRRRLFRWGMPTALAAALVLAVAIGSRGPVQIAIPVATVARVDTDGPLPAAGFFAAGDEIYAGDPIETDGRGLALAVRSGLSLRLSAGTRATFESAEELNLQAGRIYADTGEALFSTGAITVHTPVGSATDIGTRFAVEFADGDMSVAVRHGKVDVAHRRESYTAVAGDKLRIVDDSVVTFEQVSPTDPSWDWVAELAPAFEIENRTLLDFLKWAARETGRELVFQNEDVRIATMGTRLSGSIADLTPAEAVHSVLPTTRFGYTMDERRLVIGAAAR